MCLFNTSAETTTVYSMSMVVSDIGYVRAEMFWRQVVYIYLTCYIRSSDTF